MLQKCDIDQTKEFYFHFAKETIENANERIKDFLFHKHAVCERIKKKTKKN